MVPVAAAVTGSRDRTSGNRAVSRVTVRRRGMVGSSRCGAGMKPGAFPQCIEVYK
ncbi:hypothetical protein L083_3080 [Actinoplanes sp. N902-109]|nr:hypothetical protein L083_3080 [Actinoplanes sp. N902-109]